MRAGCVPARAGTGRLTMVRSCTVCQKRASIASTPRRFTYVAGCSACHIAERYKGGDSETQCYP